MAGASSRLVAESVVAWSNPGRSTSAPSYDHLFSNPAPAPAPASPIGSLFGSFLADAGARAKPTPSSPLIWELLCVETSASHGLVGVKSAGSKSDSDAQSFVDSERIPTKGKCAQGESN